MRIIAPTDEAPIFTSKLAKSIEASVLPDSFFIFSRTREPFFLSNINVFTLKREIEKIAASIPEKKALKKRKINSKII